MTPEKITFLVNDFMLKWVKEGSDQSTLFSTVEDIVEKAVTHHTAILNSKYSGEKVHELPSRIEGEQIRERYEDLITR